MADIRCCPHEVAPFVQSAKVEVPDVGGMGGGISGVGDGGFGLRGRGNHGLIPDKKETSFSGGPSTLEGRENKLFAALQFNRVTGKGGLACCSRIVSKSWLPRPLILLPALGWRMSYMKSWWPMRSVRG